MLTIPYVKQLIVNFRILCKFFFFAFWYALHMYPEIDKIKTLANSHRNWNNFLRKPIKWFSSICGFINNVSYSFSFVPGYFSISDLNMSWQVSCLFWYFTHFFCYFQSLSSFHGCLFLTASLHLVKFGKTKFQEKKTLQMLNYFL